MNHPVEKLRTIAGLTQYQLAKRVGVSDQYIGRVEKGLIGIGTDLREIDEALFNAIENRDDRMGYPGSLQAILRDQKITVRSLGLEQVSLSEGWHLSILVRNWYEIKWAVANLSMDDEFRLKFANRSFATFREFRELLQTRLPTTKANRNGPGAKKTLYNFCVDLGLHPYLIQRFEREHGPMSPPDMAVSWPSDLRTALARLGVPLGGVTFTGRERGVRGLARKE